jgi:hypothetical protein
MNRKRYLGWITLAGVIALASLAAAFQHTSGAGKADPAALPAPKAQNSASKRASETTPEAHRFAWNLFHALLYNGSGDSDWGDWSTWSTKANLCLQPNQPCEPKTRSRARSLSDLIEGHLEFPVQESNASSYRDDLANSHMPDSIPYATVLYNRTAAQQIQANAQTLTMNALLHNHAQEILALGDGSIVIKTFWELLVNAPSQPQNESLNVWDPTKPPPSRSVNGSFGIPTVWTNSIIYVDPSKTGTCSKSDYELATGPLNGAVVQERVPLGCFYSLKVTEENRSSVESGFVPSTHPKPGDFIVLLGAHIIKKVKSRWVWSTFWWTNRPSYSSPAYPSYNDRPLIWDRRWGHYVMNTTETALNAANQRSIVFNPYIEGAGANPAVSNCILCHARAAFNANVAVGESLGSPDIDGELPAHATVDQDKTYFYETVRTDYLWSLVSGSSAAPGPQ